MFSQLPVQELHGYYSKWSQLIMYRNSFIRMKRTMCLNSKREILCNFNVHIRYRFDQILRRILHLPVNCTSKLIIFGRITSPSLSRSESLRSIVSNGQKERQKTIVASRCWKMHRMFWHSELCYKKSRTSHLSAHSPSRRYESLRR